MLKRVVFSVILAGSAYETIQSGDSIIGNKSIVIALIAAELIFMAFRYCVERPYLKRQKCSIITESVLMSIAYLIMYLWNDTGVIVIYVSLIFFFFIAMFVEDLVDVYNDSQDEFYDD